MVARPVRLGLIGAGAWGKNFIATIAREPEAELVVVCNLGAGAVPPAVEYRSDWRDVIARRDLDGVIVATPPEWHVAMATAAIEAGLAVLVEKPVALDVASAERLLALAERRSARVLV